MAYNRPNNLLIFAVGDANYALFWTGTPVGTVFYLFKQLTAVTFDYMAQVGTATYFAPQDLVNAVNTAGGEVAFIKGLIATINALFRSTFGSSQPAPQPSSTLTTANVVDRLNAALQNSFEVYLDSTGTPQIRAK